MIDPDQQTDLENRGAAASATGNGAAVGSREPPAGLWLILLLAAYLLLLAGAACCALIAVFPSPATVPTSAGGSAALPIAGQAILSFGSIPWADRFFTVRGPDQGLVLLALLAGILGSFMHAAQSLGAYVGNRQLRASWALWYVLRPPVGGILGLLFYFIVRAGLVPAAGVADSNAVSPYGVVAFGALAGWFSKRATDKLAEVFETLFRTSKDLEYKDKLVGGEKPKITDVNPTKIVAANHVGKDAAVVLTCENLASGAWASLNGKTIPTLRIDNTHVSCTVPESLIIPGTSLSLIVTNPPPVSAPSFSKGESSEAVEIVVE